MNIIITDIDGVLFPFYGHSRTKWGEVCVREYNRIVEETNAKCVVSSTWRVRWPNVNDLQNIFIQQGVCVDVIGITPIWGEDRGLEIKHWLDENTWSNYVILDDKMGGISNYPELRNFIQPISYKGLTKELADKAIEYLKQQ
jgi:hypothetical protein